MKKVCFIFLAPLLLPYLAFGVVHYIRTKDDVHFSVLNDIAGEFLDI